MDEFSPKEFLGALDDCVDSYQRAKDSGAKSDFRKAYKKAHKLYRLAWAASMCHLLAQIADCVLKFCRKDYVGLLIAILALIGLILTYKLKR